MAVIDRRSIRATIPASTTLASANALSGVTTGTQNLDVGGTTRVLIVQINNGAAGTAGIDVIETSKDGGGSWAADPTLLALASSDSTGTVVTTLNAAGVAPTGAAVFKSGPHEGPTLMRCSRLVTQNAASIAWVTGSPQVIGIPIA